MTIGKWKTRLKKLCKDAGTYDKKLDPNIEVLSQIMARLDEMYEQFDEEGRVYIEEHEGKNGAMLKESNQLLIRIERSEEQARNFLSELGLTAKGIKNSEAGNQKGTSKLEQLTLAVEKIS